MNLKEWPMPKKTSDKRNTTYIIVNCAQAVDPENKATALLITHCQRSDTCKKPGTAFTMEYQMP
eukprot:5413852-Amphidinium_carterae.1